MSLSNYFHSLEWDLRNARAAKTEIEKLFRAREEVMERAKAKYVKATEDFREVSILRSEILQKIGEFQGERFDADEAYEDWMRQH